MTNATIEYPWRDPEPYNDRQVRVGQYMLVRREWGHCLRNSFVVCHTKGMEKINDEDWELFRIAFYLDLGGVRLYYGNPVEGLGMFHCQVLRVNVRGLTDAEITTVSGLVFGMHGSHTCKDSGVRWGMPQDINKYARLADLPVQD